MKAYYINKQAQANGDHEVHHEGCLYLPFPGNRIDLGNYSSCHEAVKEAKKTYLQSNVCFYCCRDCYTS